MTKKAEQTFAERCYALLKRVPKGKVTTYRELAHAMGTKAYRAVGTAMAKNPYAPKVPCHRVVQSSGKIGGFAWGPPEKIKMLKREGIDVRSGKVQDLKNVLYRF